MEEKMKIYDIILNDEYNGENGISLISLVDSPAIEMKGVYMAGIKLPPCHPNCRCEIDNDGFWNVNPVGETDLGNPSPCEWCLLNKRKYDNSSSRRRRFNFSVDKDKQIIVGPVLIPDKLIERTDEETGENYYIRFSKEVIYKLVEKFNRNGSNRKINLEHTKVMVDGFILEDWIVEDKNNDKSKIYGLDVPVGTYMVKIKIDDKELWQSEVKENERFGFSIEGLLEHKLVTLAAVNKEYSLAREFHYTIDDLDLDDLMEIFDVKANKEQLVIEPKSGESKSDFISRCIIKEMDSGKSQEQSIAICISKSEDHFSSSKKKIELESYNDYPIAARENAQIALNWAEKNGWGDCGTPVGKARANQLAKGEPISRDTIARMAAFERHRQNSQKALGDGCGRLMWQAWGGDEGIAWAQNKLKEIDREKLNLGKISMDYDDTLDTERGMELARRLIVAGNEVYIISARSDKSGLLYRAKQLGIPADRVWATGSNKSKEEKVKELGIIKHYDNNKEVVDALPGIGVKFIKKKV